MEVIESLTNEKVKYWNKLKNKKYRDESGLFLVEGEHLVLEAQKCGLVKQIITTVGTNYVFDDVVLVSEKVMKELSSLITPPGIIAVCSKKREQDLGNRLLLLDAIQDPGNLGTIIRSATAFGINTIILGKGCVDLYNEKVIRASEGMIFNINIIERDLITFIDELKELGFRVYGTNVEGGLEVSKATKTQRFAFIVGNEGAGVSNEILAKCDEYLYIPMDESCESLNVAIATSIILYELNKGE